jgi:hypothetical protein
MTDTSNYFRGYARDVGLNPIVNGADNVQDALDAGFSTPGTAIVRAFPFTFATAGLVAGHAVYTPTAGDVLLEVFVRITTPWDGTTPFADIGTFDAHADGLWANFVGQAIDLGNASAANSRLTCAASGNGLMSFRDASALTLPTAQQDGLYQVAVTDVDVTATVQSDGNSYLPAPFIAATPIKVCVSTAGATGGSDPGASAGAATLYLVTATPA